MGQVTHANRRDTFGVGRIGRADGLDCSLLRKKVNYISWHCCPPSALEQPPNALRRHERPPG